MVKVTRLPVDPQRMDSGRGAEPPPQYLTTETPSLRTFTPLGVHHETASGAACHRCAATPATIVRFRQTVGMVLLWQTRVQRGQLCRDCGASAGKAIQRRTLVTGWWGFPAVFVNVATVRANRRELKGLRSLDARCALRTVREASRLERADVERRFESEHLFGHHLRRDRALQESVRAMAGRDEHTRATGQRAEDRHVVDTHGPQPDAHLPQRRAREAG